MSELLHVEHAHRRAGDAGGDAEKGRQLMRQKIALARFLVSTLRVSRLPVRWRGEEAEDDVPSLHVDDAARGV